MKIEEIVLQDREAAINDGHESYLSEVIQHGCQSGIVSDLIYYNDTVKFFEEHKEEINAMLAEMIDSTGCSIDELLTNWDEEDPLIMETNNQNILAWFGYEETARKILDDEY